MRFLHLADLHIGKRVNGFPMLEDQRYILTQILQYVEQEQPDCVLLCGDVYDKPQPSEEAVRLFDGFLTELSARSGAVLLIAGNHDSAGRLAFAAGLLRESGVYMARPFAGEVEQVRLTDEFGAVNFYLLPFVKPSEVRHIYEEEDIHSYDEAIARIMREVELNEGERNILLAHQFMTGAAVSDSEELAIGGLDNVSAEHFAAFDYVALGHLHGAQRVGREELRYAGSPLKYSFSECRQNKSVPLVEIDGEGGVTIRLLPLSPQRDMREIRGKFAEIRELDPSEDYVHITLTDEEDIFNAPAMLEQKFPNLMKLDYDNLRTAAADLPLEAADESLSPMEQFEEFYQWRNNQELSEEQRQLLAGLIEEIWEGEL